MLSLQLFGNRNLHHISLLLFGSLILIGLISNLSETVCVGHPYIILDKNMGNQELNNYTINPNSREEILLHTLNISSDLIYKPAGPEVVESPSYKGATGLPTMPPIETKLRDALDNNPGKLFVKNYLNKWPESEYVKVTFDSSHKMLIFEKVNYPRN